MKKNQRSKIIAQHYQDDSKKLQGRIDVHKSK